MSTAPFIAALVGLSFEERIAAGPGVRVFRRGNEGVLAAPSADGSITRCLGIISFGIAGGLKPGLRAGSVVVAAGIVDGGELRRTDVAWSSMLLEALPGAKHAIVAGADAPVVSTEAKRAIHRDTGAVSVDMESHLAARLAARCGLPFAAVRIVADPAHRDIPIVALAGLGPNGNSNPMGVLRALSLMPSQAPLLMRVALDVAVARSALAQSRQLLGRSFGADLLAVPVREPTGRSSEPGPITPLLEPRFG